MNWGWKIAITYSLFAIGTLTVVFISSMKKVNLVEEDYYEKEIKFQDQIDRIKNARELSDDFSIQFDALSGNLQIRYSGGEALNGNIHLYRPSDSDLDMNIPLNLDQNGKQVMDTQMLLKGLWVVKISWEATGKSYYKSEQINIQ